MATYTLKHIKGWNTFAVEVVSDCGMAIEVAMIYEMQNSNPVLDCKPLGVNGVRKIIELIDEHKKSTEKRTETMNRVLFDE